MADAASAAAIATSVTALVGVVGRYLADRVRALNDREKADRSRALRDVQEAERLREIVHSMLASQRDECLERLDVVSARLEAVEASHAPCAERIATLISIYESNATPTDAQWQRIVADIGRARGIE